MAAQTGSVRAVCASPVHGFSKQARPGVRLIAGVGVQGDAHAGAAVQHLYLQRRNPSAPNRMQVHLLASEVLDALGAIGPGELGENITTAGLDLTHLPAGTRLRLGRDAIVELTTLRQPCVQMERFRPGLLARTMTNDPADVPARAGVMSIVVEGGEVRPGDTIVVELPPEPHQALAFTEKRAR